MRRADTYALNLQAALAAEGVTTAEMGSKVAQLVEELNTRKGELDESNTAISTLQREHQQAREHLAASVAQAGSAWTQALLQRVLLTQVTASLRCRCRRLGLPFPIRPSKFLPALACPVTRSVFCRCTASATCTSRRRSTMPSSRSTTGSCSRRSPVQARG